MLIRHLLQLFASLRYERLDRPDDRHDRLFTHGGKAENIENVAFAKDLEQYVRWKVDKWCSVLIHWAGGATQLAGVARGPPAHVRTINRLHFESMTMYPITSENLPLDW